VTLPRPAECPSEPREAGQRYEQGEWGGTVERRPDPRVRAGLRAEHGPGGPALPHIETARGRIAPFNVGNATAPPRWSGGTQFSPFTPATERPLSLRRRLVIFIVVKFTVRPERAEEWPALVEDFTRATREEPGNLFFEWSRSVDTPDQFVLVEALESSKAGEAHVTSDHFKAAMAWMPDVISKTPEIVNVEVPGNGWSQMAELAPRT
jgi:quinol monooxygenase YgiN